MTRSRATLLPFALVALAADLGCRERPSAQANPKPEPVAAPKGPACEHDRDCVGRWNPSHPPRGTGLVQTEVDCGPPDRCVGGQCLVPPAMSGRPGPETGSVVFETPKGDRTFQVEVASDAWQTTRGLMCRPSMRADWGMLFLMRQTRRQRFWMKNTLIPLDMVFVGEDWTVVGVVASAVPRTLRGRGVDRPSRYVVELKGGVAAATGIVPGTRMRFVPPGG